MAARSSSPQVSADRAGTHSQFLGDTFQAAVATGLTHDFLTYQSGNAQAVGFFEVFPGAGGSQVACDAGIVVADLATGQGHQYTVGRTVEAHSHIVGQLLPA